MKIDWFGHSCFCINDSLAIDPYKDNSVPGYSPLRINADKVICSHEHADHSGRECVELSGNDCPLEVRDLLSWHDDQGGALRGMNTIFIITDGKEKAVHLGDLGCFPDENQLKEISKANYLMIPVGGYYTIDSKVAAEICKAVQPEKIIPMHYRWGEHGYPEIGTLDEFLNEINDTSLANRVIIPKMTK